MTLRNKLMLSYWAAVLLSILSGSLLLAAFQLLLAGPLSWRSPDGAWQLGLNLDFGGDPVSLLTVLFAGLTVTLPLSLPPAFLFGLLFSRPLGRRIANLHAAMNRLAGGAWEVRAPVDSSDELGQLALRFNGMAERLAYLTRENAQLSAREERTRIQRDIHDGIKQNLFGIGLAAQTALDLEDTGRGVREFLHRIIALERDAMGEISRLLGSAPADRGGTSSEVVRRAAADVPLGAGIPLNYGRLEDFPLDAESGERLYWVIRESLVNAGRHSGAGEVVLELYRKKGRILVRVSDNGRGYPTGEDPFAAGRGLAGMRDRIISAGGTLTAGGRPGGGFVVEAVFSGG